MSTSVYITFDQRDEGVRRDDFDAWARPNGLVFPAPHSVVYRKGPEIEVDYHSKRAVTFSTFYMGDKMPELIRLALAFWGRFGGRMQAAPEVMVAINQAFLAMNPVPQEAKS